MTDEPFPDFGEPHAPVRLPAHRDLVQPRSRDSILVVGGLSLVTGHGHNDGALASVHIAFRMKDLLPRTKNEFAIRNGYGERWPE
jgi:hypothetical protein